MPELTDSDAFKLIMEYYCTKKHFSIKDAVILVDALCKMDIIELVMFAFEEGVRNERD